jgi:hypothetical protein
MLTTELLRLLNIVINDLLKLNYELLVNIVDLFTAQNDDRLLKILNDELSLAF